MVSKALPLFLLLLATNGLGYCKNNWDSTAIQEKQLNVILNDYKRVCGLYPTTEQGLDALVTKPKSDPSCKNYEPEGFMKKIPKDAWDAPFKYTSNGTSFRIEGSHGIVLTDTSDEVTFSESHPWRIRWDPTRILFTAFFSICFIGCVVSAFKAKNKSERIKTIFFASLAFLAAAGSATISVMDRC